MTEDRIVYRRKLSAVRSWTAFSVGHVAFALHRLTGWLLLGWVGLHLAMPAVRTDPSAVYVPGSDATIVAVLAVLVFHGFNGVRLLLAEFGGVTADQHRLAFRLTLVLSLVLIVLLGVGV